MRRSPTAYSISVRPVSSRSAARLRTRSPSIERSPLAMRCPVSSAGLVTGGFENARHGVKRQQVALGPQPHDDAVGGKADVGMMAPRLPAVDVREVHLDH